jgi:transposase
VEDLRAFQRQGLSISEIHRLTGFDRKTIRKYLRDTGRPRYGPRPPRPSKLTPYTPYLAERLQAGVWNARVLLRELQERGYAGGYTILKDYLRPQRQAARTVAVRRFETPPGHQAQVDWGLLGVLEQEAERQKVWGFAFTLGYSRAMVIDIALDQRLGTFLRLHEEAFQQLGGVPAEILYDRVKTVWLGTDERGEVRWHPVFLDFARSWGFTPRLCRPYRAQTKGKVESSIRYVRRNALQGLDASSPDDLRTRLRAWTWEVANHRVHGTTGRVVWDAWQEEVPHLGPLGGRPPFPYLPECTRRVARDAYVTYGTNRYSVPWTAAGHDVALRERGEQLEILQRGQRLAVHPLCQGRHQVLTEPAHHQGMPLGPIGQSARTMVHIRLRAPAVEVRPLAVYDTVAGGDAS